MADRAGEVRVRVHVKGFDSRVGTQEGADGVMLHLRRVQDEEVSLLAAHALTAQVCTTRIHMNIQGYLRVP